MKGWYSDYNLGYIQENVFGEVRDSYPDPLFTSPGGAL